MECHNHRSLLLEGEGWEGGDIYATSGIHPPPSPLPSREGELKLELWQETKHRGT